MCETRDTFGVQYMVIPHIQKLTININSCTLLT
jgi:hypothetical protein